LDIKDIKLLTFGEKLAVIATVTLIVVTFFVMVYIISERIHARYFTRDIFNKKSKEFSFNELEIKIPEDIESLTTISDAADSISPELTDKELNDTDPDHSMVQFTPNIYYEDSDSERSQEFHIEESTDEEIEDPIEKNPLRNSRRLAKSTSADKLSIPRSKKSSQIYNKVEKSPPSPNPAPENPLQKPRTVSISYSPSVEHVSNIIQPLSPSSSEDKSEAITTVTPPQAHKSRQRKTPTKLVTTEIEGLEDDEYGTITRGDATKMINKFEDLSEQKS